MKVKEYGNYRVTVYPDEPLYIDSKDTEEQHRMWMEACRGLIGEIKRHVDFGSIDYDIDTTYRCSFCNWEWEEEENGQPLCCEKAISEWEGARDE